MAEVIVIGGGASGMMAAIAAAQNGHQVCLLEKNEKLGKKIYITGKGRCNVTNACDFDTFLQHVTVNPRFLYSSLRGFFNGDLCSMLEAAGCPLKTERGERVFPVSDHASDVTKALLRLLEQYHVDVRLRTEVKAVEKCSDGRFCVRCKNTFFADAVIVATGGLSYPSTGSTGDGYRFAENFGISETKKFPSLVPLTAAEEDCKELQGLSLKNVSVSAVASDEPKKVIFEDFGELLFTHFGLSGPLILSASAKMTETLALDRRFVLSIDLKPALSEEKLDERILRDFAERKNTNLGNAVGGLLPQALRPVILRRAGISPEKKVHDVTKVERERLLHVIKHFTCTITGTRGFSEAVITKGGVAVSEINPKTMEAKRVPGLYFAGEVLDVDALTGGFNLQIAFSTGFAAGSHIK